MITLTAHGIATGILENRIGRVTLQPLPAEKRTDAIRVLTDGPGLEDLSGYVAIVSRTALPGDFPFPAVSCCSTDHLRDLDIVSANPFGNVRSLIRHGSKSNTLFATDRCNSLCLMCSQPPRNVDDTRNAEELVRIVNLMDPNTSELGITGGEPTLLGDGFLRVIEACRDVLPTTAVHVLSNGRRFSESSFASRVAAVRHPRLMIGIPLYSDIDALHDYVVQTRGAYDETIIGLHNLALCEVPVEIRVVIQRHTAGRLVELSEFIYRNLTFAAHVAFMGMEITGFAKSNLNDLWIDAADYAANLETAVRYLANRGFTVSVYNHQLCQLPPSMWPFCRQSISDWKNEFPPECDPCTVKAKCGGFFAWNLSYDRARRVFPLASVPVIQL